MHHHQGTFEPLLRPGHGRRLRRPAQHRPALLGWVNSLDRPG